MKNKLVRRINNTLTFYKQLNEVHNLNINFDRLNRLQQQLKTVNEKTQLFNLCTDFNEQLNEILTRAFNNNKYFVKMNNEQTNCSIVLSAFKKYIPYDYKQPLPKHFNDSIPLPIVSKAFNADKMIKQFFLFLYNIQKVNQNNKPTIMQFILSFFSSYSNSTTLLYATDKLQLEIVSFHRINEYILDSQRGFAIANSKNEIYFYYKPFGNAPFTTYCMSMKNGNVIFQIQENVINVDVQEDSVIYLCSTIYDEHYKYTPSVETLLYDIYLCFDFYVYTHLYSTLKIQTEYNKYLDTVDNILIIRNKFIWYTFNLMIEYIRLNSSDTMFIRTVKQTAYKHMLAIVQEVYEIKKFINVLYRDNLDYKLDNLFVLAYKQWSPWICI